MMFELIMNMPVRSSGALIHRIVITHEATSLEELIQELERSEFLIAEEWHPHEYTKQLENKGPIAINYRYIGKIKVWGRQ